MKKNRRFRAAVPALAAACAIAAVSMIQAQPDETVFIKAGTIFTSDKGRVISGGGILVRGKKIAEVQEKVKPPKGARIVDLGDSIIIPGMIDAFSHLGFHQENYNVQTEPAAPWRALSGAIIRMAFGLAEEAPRGPSRLETKFKASEAVFYGDESFRAVLAEGILSALIAIPSDGLTGGTAFVANLADSSSPAALSAADPAAVVFSLSGDRNVTKRYGDLQKTFLDAREYRKRFEKYQKDLKKYKEQEKAKEEKGKDERGKEKTAPAPPAPPTKELPEPKEPRKDENQEMILRILDRKIPALVRASRENEILAALKIKDEFGIRLVIVGGQEAYKIPAEIKTRNVSVIVGPEAVVEKKGRKINVIQELRSQGIAGALGSFSQSGAEFLPFGLAYAVQYGLSPAEALDSVTAQAAEILGLGDRKGSIAAGKDADFVVLDRTPFDLAAKVKEIYHRGMKVHPHE